MENPSNSPYPTSSLVSSTLRGQLPGLPNIPVLLDLHASELRPHRTWPHVATGRPVRLKRAPFQRARSTGAQEGPGGSSVLLWQPTSGRSQPTSTCGFDLRSVSPKIKQSKNFIEFLRFSEHTKVLQVQWLTSWKVFLLEHVKLFPRFLQDQASASVASSMARHTLLPPVTGSPTKGFQSPTLRLSHI